MEPCFSKSWDVFVAGGGPAGLATAIAARQRGLSVLVADGTVPPIDKPCGEGLLPEGVEALRRLGISVPENACYPFRGIRFVSGDARATAEFPRGTAYGIRRTHLHGAMVDHAAACGVRMLWQAAVTGLHPEGALVAGKLVRARWVVGADGASSRVRKWAELDPQDASAPRGSLRVGFRCHYRATPWTDFMELHWGQHCQVYVTPVGRNEICLALILSSPRLRTCARICPRIRTRVEDALDEFPELHARLKNAELVSRERGAITLTRTLRRVHRGRTVLVGDAAGGVDAITGEGLCLALRQATLLADSLASGDLARYQPGHRALFRRPALMARLMLFLSRHGHLRQRSMQVFQSNPRSFARMLAMHVGEGSARDRIASGIALGWDLLKA